LSDEFFDGERCGVCLGSLGWCVGSFSLGIGEIGLLAADVLRAVDGDVDIWILGERFGLIGACIVFEGDRGLGGDKPRDTFLGRSSGLRDRADFVDVEDERLDEARCRE
jgi:hypothetical protein